MLCSYDSILTSISNLSKSKPNGFFANKLKKIQPSQAVTDRLGIICNDLKKLYHRRVYKLT